jgi:lipoyl(octanoyl) transferase
MLLTTARGRLWAIPIMHLKENGIKCAEIYLAAGTGLYRFIGRGICALQAYRDPNYRGVWLQNQKITAIGCAVKQWVTLHGFAFNVNTNLEHFQFIQPLRHY